jgi:hypothetical protein
MEDSTMATYKGKRLRDFNFYTDMLIDKGRINISAVVSKDGAIKARCYNHGSEKVFTIKKFNSVEQFHDWYYSLDIIVIIKKHEHINEYGKTFI